VPQPPSSNAPHPTPLAAQAAAQRRLRAWKDALARYTVAVGGIAVVGALLMIFVYLGAEVLPLFRGAAASARAAYPAPGGGRALFIAAEEQAEVGVRFIDDGRVVFFALDDGKLLREERLPGTDAVAITSAQVVSESSHEYAFGLADGRVVVARHEYADTFPDGKRVIVPQLGYPLGAEPLVIDSRGRPLRRLALQHGDDGLLAIGGFDDGASVLVPWSVETSFLDGSTTLTRGAELELPQRFDHGTKADFLLINPLREWLFAAAADGELLYIDVRDPLAPKLLNRLQLARDGEAVTSLGLLGGGISLIASYSSGRTEQWFPVRDAKNRYQLRRVRELPATDAPVTGVSMEERRKGFVTADATGHATIYYTTSQRLLLRERVSQHALRAIGTSPRADAVVAEDETGMVYVWDVENRFPQVSWQALWGKVWYESYPEPDYVWQSSSASGDFEPKFSLAPLSFGSLKAALYAMLVAIPLALMGAIYTAYFMTPELRQVVKPAVEVMAALPSVILGFLAGLWLAPFLEQYLPGVFLFIVLLPVGIVAFGWCWDRMPTGLRRLVPEGALGALLVPVVVLIGVVAFGLSRPVEVMLFGGNMPHFLSTELGIGYDQRNALVVGITMGFAVIPIIFSIAEDAIFGVPKHLSNGSLALGATPWQTLALVVLPTASPGIFSAVMIGLGRAVGETMIVLMATGNTPVMDLNLFEGMRTLAANIAVEMPESEVGATHYRVLCLAALVLFIFTFVLNTAAEVVRQRLREKYSSL
jgi:phosphate transport system permease protein